MEYTVRYRGASHKTRCIEVYFPLYKESVFIDAAPIGLGVYGFSFHSYSKNKQNKEIRSICHNIAHKHLAFIMGCNINSVYDFDWWKFQCEDWRKNYKNFNLNDEELEQAINSFNNKYEKINNREFKFVE